MKILNHADHLHDPYLIITLQFQSILYLLSKGVTCPAKFLHGRFIDDHGPGFIGSHFLIKIPAFNDFQIQNINVVEINLGQDN